MHTTWYPNSDLFVLFLLFYCELSIFLHNFIYIDDFLAPITHDAMGNREVVYYICDIKPIIFNI